MTASDPNKPPITKTRQHLHPADARAVVQLATQATRGVTRIVEGVNQSVWGSLGASSNKTVDKSGAKARGITDLVFKTIHGVTQFVGTGADKLLQRLEPLLLSADAAPPDSPQRAAVLAALNGVMGDRLAKSNNPFATKMTLRFNGTTLDWQAPPPKEQVSAKVLVLIHGLCMNDLQWHTRQGEQVVDHGATLAAELGYTPLYLRYNTGLHTSQNGHELSKQLEALVSHWPVKVKELTLVVHSMGGLIARSAVQEAQEKGLSWPKSLKSIAFLGTPHHGAPLERAGNWVDVLLGSTPFSAPFKQLSGLRSAGITDLRYGFVLDADWHDPESEENTEEARLSRQPDRRVHLPLPAGVACYAMAATIAAKRSRVADRLLGDGLVPLHSALGEHTEPARNLNFDPDKQLILYRTNHMQLLRSPAVTQQLVAWLS